MRTSLICLLVAVASQSRCDAYDYIIVGAGTAGLVVANRLSEDPRISVAVIDPGRDARDNANVSSITGFLHTLNTPIDWQYQTLPQAGLGNRSLEYHAGKAIGGTSIINGMTYIRADAAEIDAWEALGSPGWNWDELFPYYKGAEDFSPPSKAQETVGASWIPQYHGTSGNLKTAFPYELVNGSFFTLARQTWGALGYPWNPDENGGDVHGFSVWPMTVDRDADVRESAARAYYYPIEDRPNLTIINGTVIRVIWKDTSDGSAVADGVEYLLSTGETSLLSAKKEVVLSAGALRTPLILEMSGVGSPSFLADHGIKAVIDLPGVGENLQDQPETDVIYAGSTSNMTGYVPYATFINAYDTFGHRTAAIAASSKASLAEWAKQVSAANNHRIDAAALQKIFEVQYDLIFNKNVTTGEILTTASSGNLVTVSWPLLPFSRGSVHLQPAHSISDPAIDPKYLLLDFDLEIAISTGRIAQSLWYESPMRSIVTGYLSPGNATLPSDATDAQWALFIKKSATPNSHALGTASMMARELGGVVDAELRVYGTSNVRVVDASVMPLQVSGHLTATLYAIAERASVLIRESCHPELHDL